MADRFIAAVTTDRSRVVMRQGAWRHTIPVHQARDWLEMYRKLWGRKAQKPGEAGPYGKFYAQAIEVMDRIVAEIEGHRA